MFSYSKTLFLVSVMPIFIFLHLKSWFLFTDFLLKTYFHLVCFDVLLLPQFLPDHLHFPSCQSLCSFLSFKTNKNKRNTCTLPSSRWKCKQKTNKIKKICLQQNETRSPQKYQCVCFALAYYSWTWGPVLKVWSIYPGRLHWRKGIFLRQWYQLQKAFWLGRGKSVSTS